MVIPKFLFYCILLWCYPDEIMIWTDVDVYVRKTERGKKVSAKLVVGRHLDTDRLRQGHNLQCECNPVWIIRTMRFGWKELIGGQITSMVNQIAVCTLQIISMSIKLTMQLDAVQMFREFDKENMPPGMITSSKHQMRYMYVN